MNHPFKPVVRRKPGEVSSSLSVQEAAASAKTPEERAAAFLLWAESQPEDGPLLSEEGISRESIYGDRD